MREYAFRNNNKSRSYNLNLSSTFQESKSFTLVECDNKYYHADKIIHRIYQHADLKPKFIICGDDHLDQLESYGFGHIVCDYRVGFRIFPWV